MDSAEAEQMAAALGAQDARLSRQEEFQTSLASHISLLSSQIQGLRDLFVQDTTAPRAPTVEAAPPPTAVVHGSGGRLAPPEKFAGEQGLCKTFLIDCSIHFELTPHAFPTERSKVAFMMTHLTGRAKAWASAEWARDSPLCFSLTEFKAALQRVFDPVSTDREKAQELSRLRQGDSSVCDYVIHFRTLAAESGWNSTALYDVFLKGLGAPVQDLLVPLDLPPDLDSLIALAIRTDNRLRQLRRDRSNSSATAEGYPRSRAPGGPDPQRAPPDQPGPFTTEEGGEPMQLGRARLTTGERLRRQQEGRCF
uniref:Retrotransposon gag domain-containing protein n=1 Tax=Gasterosteus aculeatus aculeatus TaxID=481459 RepID=A0AAQ4RVN1_GASAC